jgi:hypothetical protein
MATAPDGNWDDFQSRANNGALDGWAVPDWIIHETPENLKLQGRLVPTLFGFLDLEGAPEKLGLRARARVSSLEKSIRSLTSRGSDWPMLGPWIPRASGRRGGPATCRRLALSRRIRIAGGACAHRQCRGLQLVHRHPRIFEKALDLAAGLGIPLRAPTPEMARRMRERHLPAVDQAVGDVAPDTFWQADRLVRFPRGLPPGVTELMCHPGYADDALSVSSYCAQREVELRALCHPRVKDALRAAGVRCIAYGDLAADEASRR